MESILENSSLNKHQLEILKLLSRDMEEADLLAIKRLIVKYLAEKITKQADTTWDEKKWTEEKMEALLEEPVRTPYSAKSPKK